MHRGACERRTPVPARPGLDVTTEHERAQGLGQEAIKHLEVANSLRPESVEVLSRLAGLYRMTGRITDADNARRNLLALQTSAAAQK